MLNILIRLLCRRDALRMIDAFITSMRVEPEKWLSEHTWMFEIHFRHDPTMIMGIFHAYQRYPYSQIHSDGVSVMLRRWESRYAESQLLKIVANRTVAELVNF